MGRIEQELLEKMRRDGCIHLSLIDPEETPAVEAASIAKSLEQWGTAAIMVGGSTIASNSLVDETVKVIKGRVSIPVILFPNNVTGVSRYADAIWFMSLLNSNNPLFITGFQALVAPTIKCYGLETIPLAYIIIGEGSTAAYIGQAHAIPPQAVEIAVSYALAAEYLGMHFVYLEAGSGAKEPISSEMVAAVKKNVNIPVIVGGGISEHVSSDALVKAGADAIVTGTILEDDKSGQRIREIIEGMRNIRTTERKTK